jgi:hypothetical protein
MTAVVYDESGRPETGMILFGCDGQSEERDLTLAEGAEGDKLPMRPIDILRDLGMSEDTIATYLWRWQWAESSTILQ